MIYYVLGFSILALACIFFIIKFRKAKKKGREETLRALHEQKKKNEALAEEIKTQIKKSSYNSRYSGRKAYQKAPRRN